MIQGWVVWATGGFSDKELPFYWGVGFAYCGTRCTQYNTRTSLLSRIKHFTNELFAVYK